GPMCQTCLPVYCKHSNSPGWPCPIQLSCSVRRLSITLNLFNSLRVHQNQATTLFVEAPSICPFFYQRATERIAVVHLYYRRRWRVGHVHEKVSGTHASKPSPDFKNPGSRIDNRYPAEQTTGFPTARNHYTPTS